MSIIQFVYTAHILLQRDVKKSSANIINIYLNTTSALITQAARNNGFNQVSIIAPAFNQNIENYILKTELQFTWLASSVSVYFEMFFDQKYFGLAYQVCNIGIFSQYE